MAKGPAPVQFGIQVSGLKEMGRAIRAADPVLAKSLKLALRSSAELVAAEYRGQISAVSPRIAASIKTGSTLTTAYVKAGGKDAPHAPAFENMGKFGQFRHPVFGNRRNWVYQEAHPAALPALMHNADQTVLLVTKAIDEWAIAMGFNQLG